MKTVSMHTYKILGFRKCFKNKNYCYVHFTDLGTLFNKYANSVLTINFLYIWYIYKWEILS